MHASADLTRLPPVVTVHRNPYSGDDEPLFHLEIFTNKHDGGEVMEFQVDALDDLVALGQAIIAAAEKARLTAPRAASRTGEELRG